MIFRIFILVSVISTVSFAHNPAPQLPWWCIIIPNNRFCNNPSTNPSTTPSTNPNNPQCCPTGGIWGSWKEKTACSDTCGGFGTQTVERSCLTEQSCGPCTGQSETVMQCNPTPCQFPRNSCAPGLKAFTKGDKIVCFDSESTLGPLPKLSCCPTGGIMETTDWTSCNGAKCGSCTNSTRQRSCRTAAYGCGDCAEKTQTETKPCQTGPCTFPQQSCCSPYTAKSSNNQILCV